MSKTICLFGRYLICSMLLIFALAEANLTHAGTDEKHCRYIGQSTLPITFAGFAPTIMGKVNGKPMKMLVDTGADESFLFSNALKKADLHASDTDSRSYGIAGSTREHSVRVKEIRIGPLYAKNIDMTLLPDTSEDSYDVDLGAKFLFQYDMEMSLAGQLIKFFAPDGCHDDDFLAYWDTDAHTVPMKDMDDFDGRKSVSVEINGHKLRALIDSGAMRSVIYSAVAEKIGLLSKSSDAEKNHRIFGIGKEEVHAWIVPFNTFQIGDELVNNGKIEVTDSRWQGREEMILGADFLRAHRLLFASSQNRLYFSYLGGNVFYTDSKQDLVWYQKAAELGNADAEYHLGIMYEHGNGVAKDDKAAFEWYRKAAETGDARAQAALGRMYENGIGTPREETQAAVWYRKSADQDNAWGQYFLANMYHYGKGVLQDDAHAMTWYMKAAEQGNSAVDWNIGRSLFLFGKFAESAQVFQGLANGKFEERYVPIWLYLAKIQAGDGAAASKGLQDTSNVVYKDKQWPAPIVDFYLGRIERNALFISASDKNADVAKGQLCEANFYVAEKFLSQQKKKDALPLLESAAHDCPENFIEIEAARSELSRLQMEDADDPLKHAQQGGQK